jgi:hypothetical protein
MRSAGFAIRDASRFAIDAHGRAGVVCHFAEGKNAAACYNTITPEPLLWREAKRE